MVSLDDADAEKETNDTQRISFSVKYIHRAMERALLSKFECVS